MNPGCAQPRIAPLAPRGQATQLNIFRTLAHNRPLMRAFLTLGGYLLQEGVLPHREREIVILRVGWRAGSEYEFGQHTAIARAAGLTENEIARLADGGQGSWDPSDQALVDLVDQLCAADIVNEATWQSLSQRWSDAEILELLVLAGYYRLVSGMLNSVGVAIEAGTPGWPATAVPRLCAPREAPT